MDCALSVGRSQARGDVARDLQRPRNAQRTMRLFERRAKTRTLHELHGDEQIAVLGLVQVRDLNNVGVAQLVSGAGFGAEALDELWVLAQVAGEKLQRYVNSKQN